jgi:hypothetical protein
MKEAVGIRRRLLVALFRCIQFIRPVAQDGGKFLLGADALRAGDAR